MRSFTTPYFGNPDDLDAKIEKIKSAGGSVVQPREVVDEMMAWAIVEDTEGNKIGITQNL